MCGGVVMKKRLFISMLAMVIMVLSVGSVVFSSTSKSEPPIPFVEIYDDCEVRIRSDEPPDIFPDR